MIGIRRAKNRRKIKGLKNNDIKVNSSRDMKRLKEGKSWRMCKSKFKNQWWEDDELRERKDD